MVEKKNRSTSDHLWRICFIAAAVYMGTTNSPWLGFMFLTWALFVL